MGDQIGVSIDGRLAFVPRKEFERVLSLTKISEPVRVGLFANLCRLNVLGMIARAGSGHIGSSFSSLDIMSWIFSQEVKKPSSQQSGDRRIFFSSKGHDAPALYAVMIGLGWLDQKYLQRLRRLDGLPGHPDISTPCIETNTGSLGMGISKAKGMILSHRLKKKAIRVTVMTGDGELQEGQIWESLGSAVNQKMGELTVVVDHNKLQSDTLVSKVSDLGDLESKFRGFGWLVERCDGHDLTAFSALLKKFENVTDRPKIIIADTIKGKGVSFFEHVSLDLEDGLYPFHSGAPGEDLYFKAVTELTSKINAVLNEAGVSSLAVEVVEATKKAAAGASPQRLVKAYSEALIDQAIARPEIVALDADLMVDTGLLPFKNKFPDRFFECGIAEQDMVSQAGGMALHGSLPIVHSFACFLSTRANEQIFNNATEKKKIIYVGSLAGVLPGGPGHSHQSVRDISLFASVPGLTAIEPSTEGEVRLALDYCVNKSTESCYLRLVSIPVIVPFSLPSNFVYTRGHGCQLTEGDDVALFASGPVILSEAFQAAQMLKKSGVGLRVVNMPWLNYVDPVWLTKAIEGCAAVLVVDNHVPHGAMGDTVIKALAKLEKRIRVDQHGVIGVPQGGQNDEVLRAHGLDAASLVKRVEALQRVPS